MSEPGRSRPQVVVLNGASSAGKTSLGRCLQARLGAGWLLLGVDDLLDALLPVGDSPDLLHVDSRGVVHTTPAFREAEDAWYAGVAVMAAHARGVVLDEVLLDGGRSQARLAQALAGLSPAWVGVVCDLEIGLARERRRGDRVDGMHADQRERVHEGVRYDTVVDTSLLSADEAAQHVLAGLPARRGRPTAECVVRPATRSDVPVLVQLRLENARVHLALDPATYRVPDEGVVHRHYLDGVDGAFLALAELGGEVVGMVEVLPASPPPAHQVLRATPSAHLHTVVLPHARGRGVGRALVDAAEAWARGRGVEELVAGIHHLNVPADSFYAEHGYGPHGVVRVKQLGRGAAGSS